MKYIIDTNKVNVPERLLGITLTGIDLNEQVRMAQFDIDGLEELTESYIFEHFGERIGEAEDKVSKGEYQRGLEEGKKRSDYAYQRGLSDGREELLTALVTILKMDTGTRRKWFGYYDTLDILVHLQAKVIVEKTNAYLSVGQDSIQRCTGCMYENDKDTTRPCDYCSKRYHDYYKPFQPIYGNYTNYTTSPEYIEWLEKRILSSDDGKEQ